MKRKIESALLNEGRYQIKNHVIEAEISEHYESYKIYTHDEEDHKDYLLLHTCDREEAITWFIERVATTFKMPTTIGEMQSALANLILYREKVQEAIEGSSSEFDDLHFTDGLNNALFFFFGE